MPDNVSGCWGHPFELYYGRIYYRFRPRCKSGSKLKKKYGKKSEKATSPGSSTRKSLMRFGFIPSPGQTIATFWHNTSLSAQHLQAPAKRSQHFNATYRNIVGRNMPCPFCHSVATCYDLLGIENRTSVHARAQHCCTMSLHEPGQSTTT